MRSKTRSWIAGTLALSALTAAAGTSVGGCSSADSEEEVAQDVVGGKAILRLTDDERREMVSKKTTCPFVGTLLAMKKIFVYGTLADPFAIIAGKPGSSDLAPAITGSTVKAGGPGDLAQGSRIVARGNHSVSGSGTRAPAGMFSLDFPNSQGAHAAHSFILMGNPRARNTGRLNEGNLGRLIGEKSRGGHAELIGGKLVVRRSELGNFIARNVACDPTAVSISRTPFGFISLLGGDIVEFTRSAAAYAISKVSFSASDQELTDLLQGMLQVAVRNNLVGSAGEFGLIMEVLNGSPNTITTPDGERALAASDLESMFAGKKVNGQYDPITRSIPSLDTSPKTIRGFMLHTLEILRIAGIRNLADTYAAENCADTR